MTTPTPNDLLAGGPPTLKFEAVGTTNKGTVISTETTQQTDFDTGAPLTWDDGNPRYQIVVTLATDYRDPSDPMDEGERRLFVKGNMLVALRAALRAEGSKTLDAGDMIAVKYSSDGVAARRGLNPPKQFTCQVKKGAGVQADALNSEPDTGDAGDVGDLL